MSEFTQPLFSSPEESPRSPAQRCSPEAAEAQQVQMSSPDGKATLSLGSQEKEKIVTIKDRSGMMRSFSSAAIRAKNVRVSEPNILARVFNHVMCTFMLGKIRLSEIQTLVHHLFNSIASSDVLTANCIQQFHLGPGGKRPTRTFPPPPYSPIPRDYSEVINSSLTSLHG